MGRRVTGRFLATDDLNLDGHHIIGWNFLEDIPRGGAQPGQVMVWTGDEWGPTTLTGDGGSYVVTWSDVQDKPSTFPPSTHGHTWGEITEKPSFVNSVDAGSGITISQSTGDVTITNAGVRSVTAGTGITVSATRGDDVEIVNQIAVDSTEPTGFVDTPQSGYASTFTVNNNRTFTISTTTSYDVYVQGAKFTKTGTETVTFADSEGIKLFYFNENGTLATTTSDLDGALFLQYALVAVLRWDATNNTVIYVGEERHGMIMDGKTHQYLHETEGTRMVEGHALGDITADGNGASDSHATLSVEDGIIADEDLFLVAQATTNATQQWYTYYKEGATGVWRRELTGDVPVRLTAGVTATYNELNGTTWQQAELSNNQYVLAHIYRTNSLTVPYVCIQGENAYGNQGDARAGAADELNQLTQTGLPFQEFHPLGSIIYQYSSAYGNSYNVRIRTTDDGGDYVDWRFQALTPGAGPNDHGNLSGLTDRDHPTSALQQTGAVTGQIIEWTGATWLPDYHVNSIAVGTNLAATTSIEDVTISITNSPVFTGVVQANTVYVGTSTGGYPLDVAGTIRAQNQLFVSSQVGIGGALSTTATELLKVHGAIRATSTIQAEDDIVGYANIYADYDSADGRLEINIARRGYAVDLVNETGGWARGLVFYDGSTLLGGFQGYGTTGGAVSRLSMAAEYTNPLGIHLDVANGYVNVGTVTSQGARLTVYSRTEADPLIANFITNNQDAKVRIGQIGSDFGFYWKYLGTGSGAANAIGFWTENQAGADIQVWSCDQSANFTFLVDLDVQGTLAANTLTGDTIYLNFAGPDGDSYIYFYEDSATNGAFLRWYDAGNEFRINHRLRLQAGGENLGLAIESTDAECYIQLIDSAGYGNVTMNSSSLYLEPGGSPALRADPDLNVACYSHLLVAGDVFDRLRDVLTSDVLCNTSAATATGLGVSVDANAYYRLHALLLTEGVSSLSSDLEITVMKPTGAVALFTANVTASGNSPNTTKVQINVDGTNDRLHVMDGVVYTGANSGVVSLRFNLAGVGGNSSLLRGSNLELTRLESP